MLKSIFFAFLWKSGMILFEKKYSITDIIAVTPSKGTITLVREIPAAFMAASSYLSPNSPNDMMLARRIVSGNTILITLTPR